MLSNLLGWLIGDKDVNLLRTRLPDRVTREVRDRESSSEILIGWAQLSIVVTFAVLYALVPRAQGSQGFNFVPIALMAYCAFTLIRLLLSYRYRLPDWYLFLSIVTDVALLFGIIFSFHIQYDQHPTFYLKSPTAMYVFLFIALRALRFDPRYVLLSGLVAIAGWIGLVGYAVISDPSHMYVTRNYVEYMTMNAILIGAEVDKIMIIFAVTVILSLALIRGRRLLVAAVREHAAATDLKRFFAPEVARSIAEADEDIHVGEGQSRDAAVLMVDVRGFTHMSATLEPETVFAVLSCYQAAVVPIIQAHGGRIDKFLGDGILATFGAVEPSDTHAADALRAAKAIVDAISDAQSTFADKGWPRDFRIGCAVACGRVTVGVVGVENRLEFTVIGDPVNLAAKLESHNKVLDTRALSTASCLDVARGQGYTEADSAEIRRGISISGTSHPIDVAILAP